MNILPTTMDLHYSDMQGFLPFPLWCIHSPFLEASTLLCVYFIFSPFLQILLSWFSLHFLSQSHFLPICIFVALSSIYFPWFTDTFPFCLLHPLLSKSTFFPNFHIPVQIKNTHMVSKTRVDYQEKYMNTAKTGWCILWHIPLNSSGVQ